MLIYLPNGEEAVATRSVSSGRATRIQGTSAHPNVYGRGASTIGHQTKALRAGLRGTGIKVGKSNRGIGKASQQVSSSAARAKSVAMQRARTGDRAWRNKNINIQGKGAAKATKNRKRRERRAKG